MRSIVFTPSVPWGWMVQRPQQLAVEFAKKGWKVFYQQNNARRSGGLEVPENLTVCTGNQQDVTGEHIDVVFSISPLMHSKKGTFGEKIFVYDNVDDFSWHWKENETIMTEVADIVITTADILYNKKMAQRNGNSVHLVRNGVNLDDFAYGKEMPCPPDLEPIKQSTRRLVGYTGAVAYWLDWELIRYLQKEMHYINFVYVGPPFGVNLERDMASGDNIHFLGVKSSTIIPRYVKNFDVCIIPFLENDITKAANPIKLYEYLALGSKVVSTYMPEVEKYKDHIRMISPADDSPAGKAKKQEEFKNAINEALVIEPPVVRDARIKVACDNSWSSRVDKLIAIFEEKLG